MALYIAHKESLRSIHYPSSIEYIIPHLESCPYPWLFAGGTSGLGLITAQLVQYFGASDIVLLGRNARTSPPMAMDKLGRSQCLTTLLRADVSSCSEVAHAISAARHSIHCTSGLLHAAGLQVCRTFHFPNDVQIKWLLEST